MPMRTRNAGRATRAKSGGGSKCSAQCGAGGEPPPDAAARAADAAVRAADVAVPGAVKRTTRGRRSSPPRLPSFLSSPLRSRSHLMIMEAGEILRKRGLLTEEQLRQSLSADAPTVIQSAVSLGYVDERDALQALADEVGLDFVDLRETEVDLSVLKGFPQKLIYRQSLFPIRNDNGAVVVATADPLDLYPLDEASAAIRKSVIPVVAER